MKVFFIFLLLGFNQWANAWGQRGHEAVTIVAARLMAEDPRVSGDLQSMMITKENLLAHLANVPDTVWRQGDKSVVSENAPTHFFDIDYVFPKKVPRALGQYPNTLRGIDEIILKNCKDRKEFCVEGDTTKDRMRRVGHAPLRVSQLITAIEAKFKQLKSLQAKGIEFGQLKNFNEAITFMGILSHFVGDLANPLHTSSNYNGQLTGQDGIHGYFETRVVNEIDLTLQHKILLQARNSPAKKIFQEYKAKSYLDKALALSLDSHFKLDTLLNLDLKHSLIEKSKPLSLPKRKAPRDVTGLYESFIVQQLAIAADVLKELWIQAWVEHQPKLGHLKSYDFPTAPNFISIDYELLK